MKLKNIAVKVNTEQFKLVQKIAFAHGCTWSFGGLVKGTSDYLSITKDSKLSWKETGGCDVYDFIDFVSDFEYEGLFTYPLYKIDKDKSVIIKFIAQTIGECVYSCTSDYIVSQIYTGLDHHFSDTWVDISEDKVQNYINYNDKSWLEANKEVLKISKNGLVVEFVNDNDCRVLYVDERIKQNSKHFVSDEIQENWINRNNPTWSDITYEELEILKLEQRERLLMTYTAIAEKEKEKRVQDQRALEDFELNERVLARNEYEEFEATYKGKTNFGEIIVEVNSRLFVVVDVRKIPPTTKEDVINYLNELLKDKLYNYEYEINTAIRMVQRLKD